MKRCRKPYTRFTPTPLMTSSGTIDLSICTARQIQLTGRRLIRCAANPAVQGGVKSADGEAVLVLFGVSWSIVNRPNRKSSSTTSCMPSPIPFKQPIDKNTMMACFDAKPSSTNSCPMAGNSATCAALPGRAVSSLSSSGISRMRMWLARSMF